MGLCPEPPDPPGPPAPRAAAAAAPGLESRQRPAALTAPDARTHNAHPPNQDYLTSIIAQHRPLIIFQGLAGPRRIPASFLLDSGATGNFMSTAFARKHAIATQDNRSSIYVTLADGVRKMVGGVAPALPISVNRYRERIDFTVTELGGFDFILGMPWFEKYDPRIRWRSKTVTFIDQHSQKHVWQRAPSPPSSSSASRARSAVAAAGTTQERSRERAEPHLNLITARDLKRACKREEVLYTAFVWPDFASSSDARAASSSPPPPAAAGSECRPPPEATARDQPRTAAQAEHRPRALIHSLSDLSVSVPSPLPSSVSPPCVGVPAADTAGTRHRREAGDTSTRAVDEPRQPTPSGSSQILGRCALSCPAAVPATTGSAPLVGTLGTDSPPSTERVEQT